MGFKGVLLTKRRKGFNARTTVEKYNKNNKDNGRKRANETEKVGNKNDSMN
jgi:hypothetical protein